MSKNEVSKLEEQATAKADLSYSYWAAKEVKGAAPPPEAKKMTDEEAAAHEEKMKRSTSAGASVWNAAGTFEERDLTSWVQNIAIKDLFVGASGDPTSAGHIATITEIASCSGDAGQWVVRGSIRANFDLNIKVKWTAQVDGHDVVGTATIPNAAWDELDELLLEEVEVESSEGKEAGKAAAKGLLPTMRTKLEELVEKIKTYGIADN